MPRFDFGTGREDVWTMRSFIGLLGGFLIVVPCAAQAASPGKPTRAPSTMTSRCGRHVVQFVAGSVRVDDEVVVSRASAVEIAIAPNWRHDCSSVAWVEREGMARRLVVIPTVGRGAQSLHWVLPLAAENDHIFWVGRSRISVGPVLLKPRAIASWS